MSKFLSIFQRKKYTTTSEKILKQMRWVRLPAFEITKLPIHDSEYYDSKFIADILDLYVQSKFRIICSRLGISYDEVSYIFKQQNSEFFAYLAHLRHAKLHKPASYFVLPIWNVLVPVEENIQIILKAIERLSPEQQDEIVRIISQNTTQKMKEI